MLLHDPQTAGLARVLRARGALVVWRCHIGSDTSNRHAERSWSFLRPYLDGVAHAFVFSRRAFAPSWVRGQQLFAIPPSIDPFSTKNEPLAPDATLRVLALAGLLDERRDVAPVPFLRRDGTAAQLERRFDTLLTGTAPPVGAPLVVQVSRWDSMKDMAGVMQAFAEHVAPRSPSTHVALVGPDVHGVTDDPEAEHVLEDCLHRWRALPRGRARPCAPRLRPDGRPRRERARDQRAAATRRGRDAEEPRGRLRPHGRRGDVQEPPGGRKRRRRNRRPDRGRGVGPARQRPHRPGGVRRGGLLAARRPGACGAHRPTRARACHDPSSSAIDTSSATASSWRPSSERSVLCSARTAAARTTSGLDLLFRLWPLPPMCRSRYVPYCRQAGRVSVWFRDPVAPHSDVVPRRSAASCAASLSTPCQPAPAS